MIDRGKLLHIQSDDSNSSNSQSQKEGIVMIKPQSKIQKFGKRNQFETYLLQKNTFINPQYEEFKIEDAINKGSIKFVKQNLVQMQKQQKKKLFKHSQDQNSQIKKTIQNQNQQSIQQIKCNSTNRNLKGLQVFIDDQSEEDQGNNDIQKYNLQHKQTQIQYQQQQFTKITSSQQVNKFYFICTPIQPYKRLSATITRVKSGLNYFFPQLDMSFYDDFKHILSCKKQLGTTQTFHFSTSKQIFQQKYSPFAGKIKKIFLDNTFNIYQSQSSHIINNKQKQSLIVCSCRFRQESENHVLPRFFQIYLLQEGYSYNQLQGINLQKDRSLNDLYSLGRNCQKILYFRSKKPQFCPKSGAFRLNFNGRVKIPSVKNFLIEDPKTGKQMMMFGKNGDDIFYIDISYPLTPLIAFGCIIPFFCSK